jgi:hypothetical protein
LMELAAGCCRPPEHHGPDLARYRLASKVVMGSRWVGPPTNGFVIEPAYRAAELLQRVHDNPESGIPLLGRFAFDVRHKWFRNWVNGPPGQRLGLTAIPGKPVSLRGRLTSICPDLATGLGFT